MTTTTMKRLTLTVAAIAVAAAIGWGALAQAGDKAGDKAEDKAGAKSEPAIASMNKEELDAAIHDYLMANGKVIMDAVEKYQRDSVQEKSAEGIKKNFDVLFKNDKAPFMGDPKGDVVVVEFFDYNCGYCKRALPEVQRLLKEDKKVKVVFKEFPILGPTSDLAARWALAAHAQDKYFEFHQLMMEHQGQIDETLLRETAEKAGMDVEDAAKYADSSEATLQLEKNRTIGSEVGVTGTPAFLVGEQFFPGALPYEQLKAAIDTARKKD